MRLDDWRTDADSERVSLASLTAAFAVFVLWVIVLYVYITVLTPQ